MKLQEAEDGILKQKEDLKKAIEVERVRADEAREGRAMEASLDLGDKIDSLIGGFLDENGASAADSPADPYSAAASTTAVYANGGGDGGAGAPPANSDILYLPIADDVPLPYPAAGEQKETKTSSPTTLVIGTTPQSLTPSNAKMFLKRNKVSHERLQKLVILSCLGTERTNSFPWNLQNALGQLSKVRHSLHIVTCSSVLGMTPHGGGGDDDDDDDSCFPLFPLCLCLALVSPVQSDAYSDPLSFQNAEAEKTLISHYKDACWLNSPPLSYFVVKSSPASSGGKPDSEASEGSLRVGGDVASLLIGDAGRGGCTDALLGNFVDGIISNDLAGGNVTVSVFSLEDVKAKPAEVLNLLQKIDGPEIKRIVVPSDNPESAAKSLSLLMLELGSKMEKEGKMVSKVVCEGLDNSGSVRIKFMESGAGFSDLSEEDSEDNWGSDGGSEKPVVRSTSTRQGGVKVEVDGTSFQGKVAIILRRYNYPKGWEKEKVPVKEITEEKIVSTVVKAVNNWRRE